MKLGILHWTQAILLLTLLTIANSSSGQRLPEREPRSRSGEADALIREAIANNKADPQVTILAEESLKSLIWWERRVGLKYGPKHLERFLTGTGTDLTYRANSEVSRWVREHKDANYSYETAHANATKRIQAYIEKEVRGGKTNFPRRITLDSIGFVNNYVDKDSPGYKDRLQGPNLYKSGMVFQVPIPHLSEPAWVVDLIVGFGDLQGPHEGVIRNLQIKKSQKDGKTIVDYKFEVEYTWNDQFTFDNDKDMSEYDAAAHYLEFVAKTAKAYKASVQMNDDVHGRFELTNSEESGGTKESSNPDDGSGSGSTGGDSTKDSSGNTTKLPPIVIPHPPGWGVKVK